MTTCDSVAASWWATAMRLSVSAAAASNITRRRSVVSTSTSGHHLRRVRSPITATPYTRGHSG
jgi:hypothetical protein